jgi:hypothetical protein
MDIAISLRTIAIKISDIGFKSRISRNRSFKREKEEK